MSVEVPPIFSENRGILFDASSFDYDLRRFSSASRTDSSTDGNFTQLNVLVHGNKSSGKSNFISNLGRFVDFADIRETSYGVILEANGKFFLLSSFSFLYILLSFLSFLFYFLSFLSLYSFFLSFLSFFSFFIFFLFFLSSFIFFFLFFLSFLSFSSLFFFSFLKM